MEGLGVVRTEDLLRVLEANLAAQPERLEAVDAVELLLLGDVPAEGLDVDLEALLHVGCAHAAGARWVSLRRRRPSSDEHLPPGGGRGQGDGGVPAFFSAG